MCFLTLQVTVYVLIKCYAVGLRFLKIHVNLGHDEYFIFVGAKHI